LSGGAIGWANDSHCFVTPNGYHIKDNYLCYAPAGAQGDVNIQVDAQQISGIPTEPFGIAFRRASQGNYYEFDIDSNSKWVVFKCQSATNGCAELIPYTRNSAIHGGINVTNELEVRAKGALFTFLVNGKKVGQVTDATFSTGLVGVSSSADIEAVFTNIVITQLG
ncbi:MAG: hypothetical protein IVW57_14530, partial [Ktedonobacterales bacterium]|nr:hypothetical protein [Ktedonobacterales bacterium]